MESIKPQLRKHGEEVEAIDVELESIKQSIADVLTHTSTIEESLQQAIDEGGKSKLDKLIQESVDVRSEIETVEREGQDIQRLIDKCETEMQVEQGNQNALVEQANAVNEEIDSLSQQKPQFEENINKFKTAISQMESKVHELSAELEDLRQEKEKAHETCNGC